MRYEKLFRATGKQTSPGPVGSLDISSGEFHEHFFISQWRDSLGAQSKLKFYRQVKNSFGEEACLQLSDDFGLPAMI